MCRPIRSSGCGREDIEQLPVRNKQGDIIPLGTMVTITPVGRAVAASASTISIRHRR